MTDPDKHRSDMEQYAARTAAAQEATARAAAAQVALAKQQTQSLAEQATAARRQAEAAERATQVAEAKAQFERDVIWLDRCGPSDKLSFYVDRCRSEFIHALSFSTVHEVLDRLKASPSFSAPIAAAIESKQRIKERLIASESAIREKDELNGELSKSSLGLVFRKRVPGVKTFKEHLGGGLQLALWVGLTYVSGTLLEVLFMKRVTRYGNEVKAILREKIVQADEALRAIASEKELNEQQYHDAVETALRVAIPEVRQIIAVERVAAILAEQIRALGEEYPPSCRVQDLSGLRNRDYSDDLEMATRESLAVLLKDQ